jgi:hypothetical protein
MKVDRLDSIGLDDTSLNKALNLVTRDVKPSFSNAIFGATDSSRTGARVSRKLYGRGDDSLSNKPRISVFQLDSDVIRTVPSSI